MLSDYLERLWELSHRPLVGENQYRNALNLLHRTIDTNFTVFLCGNGGSSSTASHFANDLGKLVACAIGRKVRAFSLTADQAVMTTWANDTNYDHIFGAQLHNWARPGDVLVALSGSGNSMNVMNAVDWCKRNDVLVIGMTGQIGPLNMLAEAADCPMVVPSDSMQQIEDVHLILTHALCLDLMRRMPTEITRHADV